MKGLVRPDDGDALLAHGHGEETDVVLGEHDMASREEALELLGGVISGHPGSNRKLTQVGTDGGRAGVLAEVRRLRINEHRDVVRSSRADNRLAERGSQHTLGVVREDDGGHLRCQFDDAFEQMLLFDRGAGIAALDIQPQKLLHTADDPGLRDGGVRAGDYAECVDVGTFEDSRKLSALGILSPEACEEGLAAEAREIHGNVGRAACALVSLRVAQYGNGSLGRDPVYLADDVAVQHQVADDEHFELAKTAFQQIQNWSKFREHDSLNPSVFTLSSHQTIFDPLEHLGHGDRGDTALLF